jgi:hypothetical protein
MRRTVAALTAVLAIATGALATGAQADGGGTGPDNVVSADTTGTNATDTRSALKVGSYGGDNLQSENVASAYSHDCTDCRTVAVAVQAVFATGKPSTVEPKNVAVALNERCLRCSTYAFAYQYVLTTDGRVHLNRETRRDIARIRGEIADVADSSLAPPEMDARLHELATEFKAEIDQGLAAEGEHAHGRADEHHEDR